MDYLSISEKIVPTNIQKGFGGQIRNVSFLVKMNSIQLYGTKSQKTAASRWFVLEDIRAPTSLHWWQQDSMNTTDLYNVSTAKKYQKWLKWFRSMFP